MHQPFHTFSIKIDECPVLFKVFSVLQASFMDCHEEVNNEWSTIKLNVTMFTELKSGLANRRERKNITINGRNLPRT